MGFLIAGITVFYLLVRRIRRTDQHFKLLAEHMSDLVGLHDQNGVYQWVSPSADRLLGHKPEALLGKRLVQLAHPDDQDFAQPGQVREPSVFRMRRADGSYTWMEMVTSPIEGVGLVSVLRDVNARKQAEDLYRYTIRNLPNISVFLFDTDYRYLIADGGVVGSETLPDTTEIEGRTLWQVFPRDIAEVLAPYYAKVLRSGQPQAIEQPFRTQVYRIHFLPIHAPDGQVTMALAVLNNVTDYKRVIQALQDQALDLERSNRDLERFANVASHELKSPLRRIASFAELLSADYRGRIDADADEYIGHIVDGAQSLSEVIEALLTYSRVQGEAARFDWVDLNLVCDEAVEALASTIREYDGVVSRGDLPTVHGDRVLLTQLVQNLIANGMKFYDGPDVPRVTLSGRRALLDWEVSVADNGPGIAEDHRKRIFEMFQRLQPDKQGSGIGLALCKKIVGIHRGKIWVEQAKNGGSIFHFTIPAKNQGPLVALNDQV